MNLSLLLSLAALAQDGQVVLPASEVLRTLQEQEAEPVVEAAPVAWLVPSSALVLRPGEEMSAVALEVALVPVEPAWVSLPVLDGRVRITDQSLPLHQGPDGNWWFTGYLSRPLRLKVEGTLAVGGSSGQIAALQMAPGVRQEVRVQGRSGVVLEGLVDGERAGVIAPRSSVNLSWGPERAEQPSTAQVIQAQVDTAAWLDEGALLLRSKVRWEVRRGSYATLRLRIPAGATEVDVQGVGLARWERQGMDLLIEPLEPIEGAMELQVDWRQSFTKGQAQVTHPKPLDAGNATYNLTLAGDFETLLSPSAQGMRSVAVEELPPKARAIGDAPANAAWTGPGTLSLKALKLNALEGPDLVVDLARCTAAQSHEGRTLMTCSLDVRNASKQFLGVTLPEGFTLWSARVNGDGVAPVRMENGQMNVPLERSVETLAGMTAIAVELTFLGDEQAWGQKGERAHQLPAFDAPVARLEWELRLPPGYKAKAEGGSARTAGEVTSELVYASAAEAQTAVQAREVWNLALDAYQDNDFEAAQAYVDQTLALDSDNYNAVSLQTNLDVLSGDAAAVSSADEAMSRRVKDMAKAKVADEEYKQEEKLAEAERLLNEGRYEEAIESYEAVEEMSKELARYEHVESKKQSYYGSSSSSGAAEARNRASSRDQTLSLGNREAEKADKKASGSLAGAKSGDMGGEAYWPEEDQDSLAWTEETSVEEDMGFYQFDDVEITGALEQRVFDTKPQMEQLQGALLSPDGADLDADLESQPLQLGAVGSGAAGGGLAGLGYIDAPVEDRISRGDMDSRSPEPMAGERIPTTPPPEAVRPAPMAEPIAVDESEELYLEEALILDGGSYAVDMARTTVITSEVAGLGRGQGAQAPRPYTPGRSAAAPAPPPPPQGSSAPADRFASLDGKPAISATTLAIPLPDHGESVVVVQRLLEPGEAPTLTIRYRETR